MAAQSSIRDLLPFDSSTNFVFLGEAGGGKSEIALNVAQALAETGDKPVHFFDLDMTKPLFRSRDQHSMLEEFGVEVHYEEQFMDAPTLTGGVRRLLNDQGCYTVLDVGGDYIGARSIGGYAPLLNRDGTTIYYVINPFRPWSATLEHIDKVLGETLGVSHVELARLQYINGVINYLDLLDAQRKYFDAQIGFSNAVRDEYIALVLLYKALGGGWGQMMPEEAAAGGTASGTVAE